MSNNPFTMAAMQPVASDSMNLQNRNPFETNLNGFPAAGQSSQLQQDPWNTTSPTRSYSSEPMSGGDGASGVYSSQVSSVQNSLPTHQNPFVTNFYGIQSSSANFAMQAPQQHPQPQYEEQPRGVQVPSNHISAAGSQAPVHSSAVVVSQYQSNPYASSTPNHGGVLAVSPYQSNPYGNPFGDQQQVTNQNYSVPYGRNDIQQPSDQWQTGVSPVSPGIPFNPPPYTATAQPAYSMSPGHFSPNNQQSNQSVVHNRPHADSTGSDPGFPAAGHAIQERRSSFGGVVDKELIPEEERNPTLDHNTHNTQSFPSTSADIRSSAEYPTRSIEEPKPGRSQQTLQPSYDYGHQPDAPIDNDPRASPRNKYSLQLARMAPPGASPLPKADLVRKKGFVLSRISFRTIIMKKWKQSYWVQYGPHTMLWFRAQSDFDDWLNNPYHSQAERNFLIKLAVNFVHDLYKPNVRGYQVTQARTKGYGNKLVRQFKLERWMDYGPTIAAAFGSYNPKEVDDLREALVECMRNTPLNNGIRATGAVRQQPPENIETQLSEATDVSHQTPIADGHHQGGGYSRESFENLPKIPAEDEAKEPAQEVDLMDINNWDPPVPPASTQAPHPSAGVNQQPFSPQNQQQFASQNQPTYQQANHAPRQMQDQSNALVLADQPRPYPGAPQIAQPYYGAPLLTQTYSGTPPGAQTYPGAAPVAQTYPGAAQVAQTHQSPVSAQQHTVTPGWDQTAPPQQQWTQQPAMQQQQQQQHQQWGQPQAQPPQRWDSQPGVPFQNQQPTTLDPWSTSQQSQP